MAKEMIAAILRAPRFSPNNVDNDRLIMEAVAGRLSRHFGITIPLVGEEDFCAHPLDADCYLSMCRLPETLRILRRKEGAGSVVVNSTHGIELCVHRSELDALMREKGYAMPPVDGSDGYWLKRGDTAAQSHDDVVFCEDKDELARAEQEFRRRGIAEMVVSTHVVGDVIKFYGVGDGMFHFFYPRDDGLSKFGDEWRNGIAHHYPFDERALIDEVRRLAVETGTAVYGGDAIIDKSGNYYIIDFNDWPSFSRCRDEAADAIARYAADVVANGKGND